MNEVTRLIFTFSLLCALLLTAFQTPAEQPITFVFSDDLLALIDDTGASSAAVSLRLAPDAELTAGAALALIPVDFRGLHRQFSLSDNPNYLRNLSLITHLTHWSRQNPQGAWWMLGDHNPLTTWHFVMRPNRNNLSLEEVRAELEASAEATFSPRLTLYPRHDNHFSLCEVFDSRAEILQTVYTSAPIPISFDGGAGWAALRLCIAESVAYGDGDECGGQELAYAPVIWYSLHALSDDGATLLTIEAPLIVADLPRAEVIVIYCSRQLPDGSFEESVTFLPPNALEQGWTFDENGLRITDAAAEAYVDELIAEVNARLSAAPEDDALADAFAALNRAFADVLWVLPAA